MLSSTEQRFCLVMSRVRTIKCADAPVDDANLKQLRFAIVKISLLWKTLQFTFVSKPLSCKEQETV